MPQVPCLLQGGTNGNNPHVKKYSKKVNNNKIDISVDKDGRPILVDKKDKEYMDKLAALELKEKELKFKTQKLKDNYKISIKRILT
mgnify:CR=1 FL=1